MPQDGPQKAPGGPTMPQDSPRDVFLRGFLAGVPNHTCFYVSAVVSRRLTAPIYVFLRVFLESGRGPRIVQETDSYVFYRVFLACVPHHTCFYVSAVVAASFPAVLTPLGGMVISCMLVAFWQDHTGKTHTASDGAETASV